jgi:2,3-bisphosphoglycerate-independent phosphoglycerate mutase
MVSVLVIPDGAAQPLHDGVLTAFEQAHTPVLDALAAEGEVAAVTTTPPGLKPGSETGIPTLLGRPPRAPLGRGWVDAAAYGVPVPPGLIPWRADVRRPDGSRASALDAEALARTLEVPAIPTRGHRLLLLAARRPAERPGLHVWEDGAVPRNRLQRPTTIIAAPGAAAGIGRLLGARVITPPGATGDLDTDLEVKARAALAAIEAGWERVVVHIGAPDECAHRHQHEGVIEALERIDAELLAPLREAIARARGRLSVCPDHGTDPDTGAHDAAPVPCVRWGAGIDPGGPDRMTERAVHEAQAVPA